MTSFYLYVDKVEVEASSSRNVGISFDANESDVLENISIKNIVYHFGAADLLDEIGVDECKKRFDLVDGEQ